MFGGCWEVIISSLRPRVILLTVSLLFVLIERHKKASEASLLTSGCAFLSSAKFFMILYIWSVVWSNFWMALQREILMLFKFRLESPEFEFDVNAGI